MRCDGSLTFGVKKMLVSESAPAITIDAACAKYNITRGKLIGHVMRNDYDDPVPVSATEVLDDWRLQKLADKSSGS